MSMQDQFKDKAERMKQQAGKKKTRPEGRQDEASRRAPAGHDSAMPEAERARREAQDRFDQDYDA
ncbi:hypothetical protein [Streptomyces aureus]|uniref:hypothetical protein n=1 Tax=Streptomyces aureus TaxID=193461 RepID=UPI003409AB22